MKGKFALITGSTGGIGKDTAHGLLERGIKTILVAREPKKLETLKNELIQSGIAEDLIFGICLDLSDLNTLSSISSALSQILKDEKISILIENAGIWPTQFDTTKQGYEIAFGTNVLGHFVLRKKLFESDLLSSEARIVILTGDIYILEKNSTWDLKYNSSLGGVKAYCQSKLGNIWVARELQKRYPDLSVTIVHPGVISSGLGGAGSIGKFFKSFFMLDTTQGSQMSLFCATQKEVSKGMYYHNAVGLAEFPEGDPALDEDKASKYYDRLNSL
ncbi:MAG: SDR family NAD(P)-dependent oxidoreductase [Spirochaetia bacterium]|nr:SDR family NAD(P)-dependent oxidoreductase [Spirochaetia bacterium]